MNTIILHIPHASTAILVQEGYTANKAVVEREVNLLTDWFTDELFHMMKLYVLFLLFRESSVMSSVSLTTRTK